MHRSDAWKHQCIDAMIQTDISVSRWYTDASKMFSQALKKIFHRQGPETVQKSGLFLARFNPTSHTTVGNLMTRDAWRVRTINETTRQISHLFIFVHMQNLRNGSYPPASEIQAAPPKPHPEYMVVVRRSMREWLAARQLFQGEFVMASKHTPYSLRPPL